MREIISKLLTDGCENRCAVKHCIEKGPSFLKAMVDTIILTIRNCSIKQFLIFYYFTPKITFPSIIVL